MRSFELHVLSADEPMYEGPCDSLEFPCSDGQYGIQAGHTPMLAPIVPGLLKYRSPEGEEVCLSVSNGMIKVDRASVLVLVDSAERMDEIDENRARRDIEEAERALRYEQSKKQYLEAQASLQRALSRLRLKGKYRQ